MLKLVTVSMKNTLRPSHLVRSRKAGEEAQIIADKLSEIDSANKETYQKNAKNFIAKAQELTKKYQPIFEKSESKDLCYTTHSLFLSR